MCLSSTGCVSAALMNAPAALASKAGCLHFYDTCLDFHNASLRLRVVLLVFQEMVRHAQSEFEVKYLQVYIGGRLP